MSKVKVGPEMPAGAQENGGQVNAEGLDAARVPVTVTDEQLVNGPKIGERNEFLPAAYRLASGIIRVDN